MASRWETVGFLSGQNISSKEKNRSKAFLKRCKQSADENDKSGGPQFISGTSTHRSAPAWAVVHQSHRFRRRGLQGPSQRNPELGSALYQWFVDVRAIAKSRLRPRLVMTQAQILQQSIGQAKMGVGLMPTTIVIDRKWLSMWCYKWGVSLKKTKQALQGQAARPEAALVHLLVQHICDSLVLYIGVRDRSSPRAV